MSFLLVNNKQVLAVVLAIIFILTIIFLFVLLKDKKTAGLTILTVSLGVGVLFTTNIASDTMEGALIRHIDAMFGNIDYTVHRSDGLFPVNDTLTIPGNYIDTIRDVPGVESVVARVGKNMGYYHEDFSTLYHDQVFGINVSNPDEHDIGVGKIIDCLESIGNPNDTTLEEVLEYNGIVRPIVVSDKLREMKGFEIGDKITIIPQNATLYATAGELQDLENNVTDYSELETDIIDDPDRMVSFTVVAIIIDGSEAPEKPVPSNELSFSGFVPHESTMYIRMNESFDWVFNEAANASSVSYFLVKTGQGFTGMESLQGSIISGNGTIPIVAYDIRLAFNVYVDYVLALVRILLMTLTVAAWVSCGMLVKTIMQMNVKERMREIGILQSIGFKKKAVGEMLVSQVLFMSAIGSVLGLMVGMIPPQFFNIDVLIQFASYNKTYPVDPIVMESPVIISPVSILISVASGMILPFVFGLVPLLKIRKWSIVQMMTPMHMQMRRKDSGKKRKLSIIVMLLSDIDFVSRVRDLVSGSSGGERDINDSASKQKGSRQSVINATVLELGNDVNASLARKVGKVIYKKVKGDLKKPGAIKKQENRSRKKVLSYARFNPKQAIIWTIVCAGAFILYYASSAMVFDPNSLTIDFDDVWYWLLLFGLGLLLFMISTVQLGGSGIGGVTAVISRGFSWKIGKMSRYVPKSVHANTRRIKNMMGTLIVGVSLVTSLVVIHSTIMRGNICANRTYLGGDIVVFDPLVHRDDLDSVLMIEGVEHATTYLHATMDAWKFGSGGEISRFLINTVDDYGGKSSNWTENLNVVIIDVDEYVTMNPQVSVIQNEFDETFGAVYRTNSLDDPETFMRRLSKPDSVIIQSMLSETLGKNTGDEVNLLLNGFDHDLEIVGTATFLPAVPYMKFVDNEDFKSRSRSMLITRETFASMIGDFIGDVDIVIKNKSVPTTYGNDTVPESVVGYASGFMDSSTRSLLEGVINNITGIDGMASRFSSFVPGIPRMNVTFNTDRVVYSHPNATIQEGGMVTLPNRFYLINPDDEIQVANGDQESMVNAHQWLGTSFSPVTEFGWAAGPRNSTATEALYTIDNYLGSTMRTSNFDDNALCMVSKYVTMYEDVDNQTWVYEMNVGDELFVEFQENESTSVFFNFTVAGTLDNHLAYFHGINGTEREGYKLSSKSLNYNFNTNTSDLLNSTFVNLFDADANVIMTSYGEMQYIFQQITGSPFGSPAIDDLVNHVYINVNDSYNTTEIVEEILDGLEDVGVLNYSVFPYRELFIDRVTNVGSLAVTVKDGHEVDDVVDNLKEWFLDNGYDWRYAGVGTLEKVNMNSDILILNPVFDVFFTIAMFSLIASIVGLITIIYANIRKRHRELGIYKALGINNGTIRDIIFLESFTVTIIGILFGIASGIIMTWVLYNAMSNTVLIPMVFTVPAWRVFSVAIVLAVFSVISSLKMSQHVNKLSIAENIRYREV
jgi:ABC-type antimicrobial peptide transport system permease subunit